MNNQQSTVRQTIALYWQHIRLRKLAVASGLATAMIGMLSDQFIAPLIIANAFNKLTTNGTTDFWQDFGPTLAIYAGLLLLTNIMWRLNMWIVWGFEIDVKRELSERCFAYLSRQTTRFHANRFGGSLVSQTNKFVNAFERLYDEFNWSIWTNLVALVATLVILTPKVPYFVLTFIVICIPYVWFMVHRSRIQAPFMSAEATAESEQTGQLADMIANVSAVKTFAHEDLEAQLFARKTDIVRARSLTNRHISMASDTIYSSLNHSLNWTALFFGLYMVGVRHADIGLFYLITSYSSNLLERLWNMNRLMRNLNRGFADAHDMTLILHEDMEIIDAPQARRLRSVRGDIRFQDVRFAYPERPDRPLFDNFNLHIKPGEKVGLVGHSGSGKTSLTKLILRFSDLNNGQILIDGHDIASVTQASLRKAVAYVPQEPIMFHRTIAENIRYGELDASQRAITSVSKMANAHEFIAELPYGYDTLVGERGTKLSGGQRQRVAIARAMLKDAPILLLDEATSALDSESEKLIQDALWRLMEGRTAIVIAHRLSTIQKMDRIIVLDHGTIVEEGTHTELLRRGGVYAALWAHQSGGFITN